MNEEIAQSTQRRVLGLLPSGGDKTRFRDTCSELSRLVADWLRNDHGLLGFYILKGDKVCSTEKSHDILAVEVSEDEFYLFDPTIWQFFAKDESILLGVADTLNDTIKLAQEKYGGSWAISEKLGIATDEEKEKWRQIIQKNIETA
ncbi:MAG: hypothetical protein U9M89_00940 [Patescibacteria group bacterium]|nr:hypothetical protein [Patescibacteria group bacterium]